ncbi:MAG: hypothetical protein IJ575_10980 [Selenomonadaceae bacterium]|nr:hypothetical protein [Selenomonadaceae bacterium]
MKKKFLTKLLVAIFFVASFFSTSIINAARSSDIAEKYFEEARAAFYSSQIQQLILQDSPNDSNARNLANAYSTEAIKLIGQATALDPTSADYAFLASQIYRGRGAGRYAEKSFATAESLYREELKKNSNGIGENLDLAIALFAGDARNGQNYDTYKKESRHLADNVIKMCKKKRRDGIHLRAYAMACIVKDKIKEARDTLDKAVKEDPSLESFKQDFEDSLKTDPSGRRFLLYYMTIRDRNENL